MDPERTVQKPARIAVVCICFGRAIFSGNSVSAYRFFWKSFTRYLMRVIPKYKNSNAVVTKFTLKKAVSSTGMSYSQAQFAVERALSPEEYPLIAAVTEQVKALSKNVGYDAEDALRVDTETGEVMEPLN